jgi:hypothetical protein
MFSFNNDKKALESRIIALEQQNASIMREMHNMTVHYYQQLELMDRRMADRMDHRMADRMEAWHPHKLKAEMVEHTNTRIHEISQQLKAEHNVKPSSTIQPDPLSGYVVVGFQCTFENQKMCVKPVFANRCHNKHDLGLTCVLRGITAFIVDSITSFPQIKHFDLVDFRSFPGNPDTLETPEMIDIDGGVVCARISGKPKYSQVEKLDQVLAKYGVELRYDGKPIRVATA